jgi:ParB-like chromosome segregation protein Spo0J
MNKNLSPKQFARLYKPSEYGSTWSEVVSNEDFHRPVEGSLSHEDMVKSIKKDGLKEPIQVFQGHVVDGHHRAAAAIEANKRIRVQEAPSEMYEGQIKG